MPGDIVSLRPDLYSRISFVMASHFIATFDPCRHAELEKDRAKPCRLRKLSVKFGEDNECSLQAEALFEEMRERGLADYLPKLDRDLDPDETLRRGATLIEIANEIRRRHAAALERLRGECDWVVGIGGDDDDDMPISCDPAAYLADAGRWFMTVASLNSGVTACR